MQRRGKERRRDAETCHAMTPGEQARSYPQALQSSYDYLWLHLQYSLMRPGSSGLLRRARERHRDTEKFVAERF